MVNLNFFLLRRAELCPKGDDPVTPHTGLPTLLLSLSHPHGVASLDGHFLLTYLGQSMRFPAAPGQWNETQCAASFNSLANIQQVSCNQTVATSTQRSFSVVVRELPVYPAENNMFFYNGGLTAAMVAADFQCDTSLVTGNIAGLSCSVSLVNPNATFPGETCLCLIVMNVPELMWCLDFF